MYKQVNIPAFNAIILDDHELFSQGLCEVLKKIAPSSTTITFTLAEKAKQELAAQPYDFIFIDVLMPDFNVKDFIFYCKEKYPTLILLVTSSVAEVSRIKEYFALGIHGFISKLTTHTELSAALEKTYRNEKYISPQISANLAYSFLVEEDKNRLTKKETEVLRSIAEGQAIDKCAEVLAISRYTVLAHRRNIMKKLELHSASALVRYAFINKIL